MGPSPRPGILAIDPYVPGEAKADGAGRVIPLAANESNLGPSPAALAAIAAAGARAHRYPDGGSTALRTAIGAAEGLDPARIVCGAGSDELLTLLGRAFAGPGDSVLHSRHGFLMYPIIAHGIGATPVAVPEIDLRADVDGILARVTPQTRIVYLANPNNPTGSYLDRDSLTRLHRALPDSVLLVLDGAYAEYVEAADYDPGTGLVDTAGNVVMTRTFSKIHALGGLRLGWCYAPTAIVDVLNRLRDPFNVNAVAAAAGAAAIGDRQHIARARAHNSEWRRWTTDRLRALGLIVYPSVGNFVLVDCAPRDAEAIRLALKARGILVRQMHGYGLPSCLRITIGLADEMQALVGALDALLRDAA